MRDPMALRILPEIFQNVVQGLRLRPQKHLSTTSKFQPASALGSWPPMEEEPSRAAAEKAAAAILDRVRSTQTMVSNGDLLSVLRLWKFTPNTRRVNVIPEGSDYVQSDTFGLIWFNNKLHVTECTNKYPSIPRLLGRWLQDHRPINLPKDFQSFPFTSISLNAGSLYSVSGAWEKRPGFAAKRHRDDNNVGPSAIVAFSGTIGGELRYWPSDAGVVKVDELDAQNSKLLNVYAQPRVFHGTKAHEVEAFTAARVSLVFFTTSSFWKANKHILSKLRQSGFRVPTKPVLASLSKACE